MTPTEILLFIMFIAMFVIAMRTISFCWERIDDQDKRIKELEKHGNI